MEFVSPPKVQRIVSPSPLRATPTRSKKELYEMYPSPPRFLLDVLEEVPDIPIELPKHYLRDFPFRVVNDHVDPTFGELRTIATYFPGCSGVAYCAPYLVVTWPHEQVKPWPLTIGGLPLFYATPDCACPPTYAKGGRGVSMMASAEERLKPWENPSDDLIEEIATALVEKGIGLKLFGWCGVRWYAEVVSVTDGVKLPATICGSLMMWEVFSSYGESARKSVIPDGHVIDATSYSPTLRPGVHLESKGGIASSSSGIPLLGPDGKRWFTVAEHAFKSQDGEVHHPRFQGVGSLIGHMGRNAFPGWDIGLVKLDDGVSYSTMSFYGGEGDGTNLMGLKKSEAVRLGESVFLDSPYNGRCEGIVGWKGVVVSDPIDPEHPEVCFVHANMVYFGNGANDVLPGTRGSAIWNEHNEVVAFFHWYHQAEAIAYSPSVNALIEAGFTLEAIS